MDKRKLRKYIVRIILLIIAAAGIVLVVQSATRPGQYDEFATCLKDSGAKFYGAFWCPHCQAQKKMFGKSQKKLPYVECSTPDGKGQKPICIDAGIEGYPTWIFADGSQLSGEVELTTLAEKTSCALPVQQ